MHVKISYTVPVNQVPEKIQDLYDKVFTTLCETSEKIKSLKVSSQGPSVSFAELERIREELFDADSKLDNCMVMLSAYSQYLTKSRPSPEQEALTDIDSAQLEALQKQFRDAKMSIENGPEVHNEKAG